MAGPLVSAGHLNNGSWLGLEVPIRASGTDRRSDCSPQAVIAFQIVIQGTHEGVRSLDKTDRRLSQSGSPVLVTGNLIG